MNIPDANKAIELLKPLVGEDGRAYAGFIIGSNFRNHTAWLAKLRPTYEEYAEVAQFACDAFRSLYGDEAADGAAFVVEALDAETAKYFTLAHHVKTMIVPGDPDEH
jgi:hypothetical protein